MVRDAHLKNGKESLLHDLVASEERFRPRLSRAMFRPIRYETPTTYASMDGAISPLFI